MSEKDKTIIFISHATPEDNYFAAWLASKLKVLGYDPWIDLDDVRAGSSFNTVIQPIIENRAAKFLAINTKDYVRKAQDQHSGIAKELNCAESVKSIQNFLVPLKADDTPYDKFPMQYRGWSAINFFGNWQTGLIGLEKELNTAGLSRRSEPGNPLAIWFDSIKAKNTIRDRIETYYSNCFPFQLPERVYIHEPASASRKEIFQAPYPVIVTDNRILTFAKRESIGESIGLKASHEVETTRVIAGTDIYLDPDFTLKEPRKKLVWLLNKCFEEHLRHKALKCWSKQGRRKNGNLFYFRRDYGEKHKISLKRYGKTGGSRTLSGTVTATIDRTMQKVNWAFAIFPYAYLDPLPHFRIPYTVVFTNKEFVRFEKEAQRKLRRSVPSEWYNRKWFETLLAAMLKISPSLDDTRVLVSIDKDEYLEIENEPFGGEAMVGYIEPKIV